MIKRLISATLCLMILVSAFSINALADATDKVATKVADAKIYTDKDKVEKGDIVTVTVYVENVTAKNGILAVDFPLSYDKSKLSFVKLDCIFPDAWGFYGEFFGHPTPDEDPWYLRSLPDAGDLIENYTKYSVKANKVLGYKLTFKAVAEGDAFVAVEDVGNKKIMFVAYENDQVINYGGNGDRITVKIGGKEDNSSTTPVEPDDSSVAESEKPDDSSVADSSVDVSDEPVSNEPVSGEPVSGEPESGDTESSENTSVEPDSSDDVSVEDVSAQASADITDDSDDSVDAAVSGEASEASSEENSADDKTDDEKGGLPGFVVPVLIVVAVAALLGALGVVGYLFKKRKADNAQE